MLHSSPCVPECPGRKPGCNCEARKQWKAQIAARKKWLKEQETADAVMLKNKMRKGMK